MEGFENPRNFRVLMPKKHQYFLVFLIVLASCSSKYAQLSKRYTFKTPAGSPDYSNIDHWAAHPWKWDPSDSVPSPLRAEPRDSIIDVFFLHPTSLTKGENTGNASLDDALLNAKTDYSSILYQASVFNQHARVFAPRYRQAHIRNFFEKDTALAKLHFDTAYQDLRTAFLYYLNNWNNGRPFIIAGHSQGALMAEKIYKEFIEGKELEKKMIAGYFIGWPIPMSQFKKEQICEDSLDLNCLCSWRTMKRGFIPSYMKKGHENTYVTNPLSWTTTEERIPRSFNKGSVLLNFNKIYPKTTEAKIQQGLLVVRKPKFPGSFLYFKRNYHIADINLYYINLRENLDQRIRHYFSRGH